MQELINAEIESISGGGSAAYDAGKAIGGFLVAVWDAIPRFPAPNTDHYVS